MALTEIGTVELVGIKFKLGKNGHVCLVHEEEDAWGKVRGVLVNLEELVVDHGGTKISQALLDILGDTVQRLQAQRDARLGAGKGEQ